MAIGHQPLIYTSEADGIDIHAMLVLPSGEPKGVVQLAHGMAEHKRRYIPWMEFLAGQGYACAIADHRGHGETAQTPSALGHFGDAGAGGLIRDMRQLRALLGERFPGLPVFLFGHSMGAIAAQALLRQDDAGLAGLVLCGMSQNSPAAAPGRMLARLLALVQGERHKSALMDKLMFGKFTAHLPQPKSRFAWLNSDAAAVQTYDDDPLCGYLFTLNGYIALATLLLDAYHESGWRVSNPALPILLISGADDPCIGASREGLEGCASFLRARGYQSVATRLYPGMRHEILNEPGRQAVYDDVLAFLEAAHP